MNGHGKTRLFLCFSLISVIPRALNAQELPQAPQASQPPTAVADRWRYGCPHRFWDRKNGWLFAGVAVARTADYFSTLNMRRRGRQEILLSNDAVDNHAAFAAIEAAGTAVTIGTAYVLHHHGHHKLERWISLVHIGAATTGAVRNYCLKTAHPWAQQLSIDGHAKPSSH
jgi:hypothetical protein